MKNLIFLFLIIASAGCNLFNKNTELAPKQIEVPSATYEFINGSNNAGFKILSEINSSTDSSNIMISPLSISMAMTMLTNGAADTTLDLLNGFFGFKSDIEDIDKGVQDLTGQLLSVDDKVTLGIANAIWINELLANDVNRGFIYNMSYFDAPVNIQPFDANTLDQINNWVSDHTNGKITKILDELSPDQLMILLDAIYFKGDWFDQFDKSKTVTKNFYVTPTHTVKTSTMCGTISKAGLYYDQELLVGELYYGQGNFSIVFLMPETTSIDSLLSVLDNEKWQELTNNISINSDVYVELPKFTMTNDYDLVPVLSALGLGNLFDPNSCNLDNIMNGAYVTSIKHKTYIKLDEEGTEAAAVTSVSIGATAVMPGQLILNKPFIFAIRERTTNTILFTGIIRDPSLLQTD